MDSADWLNSLNVDGSPITSTIPDGVGQVVCDPVDIEKQIDILKQKAIDAEDEYEVLISQIDLGDDQEIEDYTKNELTRSIKSEKSLASKVNTMLDIILLQMQADPLKDKTRDFIAIAELSTKVNANVVKYTKEVNKVINDRKNADRQEQKIGLLINNVDNSQNLNIGSDDGEKMILKLDDLYEFGKTGNIETTQRIGEPDDCEIIE